MASRPPPVGGVALAGMREANQEILKKRSSTVDGVDTVEPVQVFVRLRPLDNNEEPSTIQVHKQGNESTVVLAPPTSSQAHKNGQQSQQNFNFSHVFDENSTQREVAECTVMPLVRDLVEGKNGCVFAYGNTNSGKTFTIQGVPTSPGLLPRALDALFNSIGDDSRMPRCTVHIGNNGAVHIRSADEANWSREHFRNSDKGGNNNIKQVHFDIPVMEGASYDMRYGAADTTRFPIDHDCQYAVTVSYYEIYNDHIYDLLAPINGIDAKRPTLQIKYNGTDNIVANLKEVEIHSTEEGCALLHMGQQARKVAKTQLNVASSRSHSVFSIRLIRAPLDAQGIEVLRTPTHITVSRLSIVDLAGSERAARTLNVGTRLREAGVINKSLSTLSACVKVLRNNQINNISERVPYADSKLTKLFRSFFEGRGSLVMMVNVNPSPRDYDETLNVLKFSSFTRNVSVASAKKVRTNVTGLAAGRGEVNKLLRSAQKRLWDPDTDDISASPIPCSRTQSSNDKDIEMRDSVGGANDHVVREVNAYHSATKRSCRSREPSAPPAADVGMADMTGHGEADISRISFGVTERLVQQVASVDDSIERDMANIHSKLQQRNQNLDLLEHNSEKIRRMMAFQTQTIQRLEEENEQSNQTIKSLEVQLESMRQGAAVVEAQLNCVKVECSRISRERDEAIQTLRQVELDKEQEFKQLHHNVQLEMEDKKRIWQQEAIRNVQGHVNEIGQGWQKEREFNELLKYKMDELNKLMSSTHHELEEKRPVAMPHIPIDIAASENPENVSLRKFSFSSRKSGGNSESNFDKKGTITHTPRGTKDTETIFSPSLDRTQSVREVKGKRQFLKRFSSKLKADRYVLTDQKSTKGGGTKTALWKGTLGKSMSEDGVSMVFQDVEELSKKQINDDSGDSDTDEEKDYIDQISSAAIEEDPDESFTTRVKRRCSIGIQGNGNASPALVTAAESPQPKRSILKRVTGRS